MKKKIMSSMLIILIVSLCIITFLFVTIFNYQYKKNIKERLHPGATIITFPISEGINFNGVVDIIKMKAYSYGEAGARNVTESDIPGDLKEQAENFRTQLESLGNSTN